MGVVRAKIQTVEDICQLLRTAVVNSVPFAAPVTAAIDGSVRADRAGITRGNFERYAISTLESVTVGCKADGSPAN